VLTVALAGVTTTLVRVGGGGAGLVTVNVVLPLTKPIVAVIVLVPADKALTICVVVFVPMDATAGVPLVHVD
jgi:hypothetical protein